MNVEQHTGDLPHGSVANGDRMYRDEYSWDQLEEDEHGRLRSSVRCLCAWGWVKTDGCYGDDSLYRLMHLGKRLGGSD